MKIYPRCLLFIAVMFFSTQVTGQTYLPFQKPISATTTGNVNMLFDKGEKLTIHGVSVKKEGGYEYQVYNAVNAKNEHIFIPKREKKYLELEEPKSVIEAWQHALVRNDVLIELLKRGYQYDLRREMDLESIDYLNSLQQQDRFFNDAYLEDYLYSLVNHIHDGLSSYNKPGNLNIKIARDIQPNAFVLPNGTMVISSGLLSTIQSEDELVGILAHEMAHYILDHHVINYNKSIDRQKRAAFWATMATLAAAGADAYLTMNNENHVPGVLTAATGITAAIVSEEIISRLGIKYSHEQELEADEAASKILSLLSYHKSGLVVALSRLKGYFMQTGDFLALSSSGTHPSLASRIEAVGIPDDLDHFEQPSYMKKVSIINSKNAWLELWVYNHVSAAKTLVMRNISNDIGTEIDYVVLAVINRRAASTKEELEAVLGLLNKAKAIGTYPHIQIHKEVGLTQLRLNNPAEAKLALTEYLEALNDFKKRHDLHDGSNTMKALDDEIQWTSIMLFKADKL